MGQNAVHFLIPADGELQEAVDVFSVDDTQEEPRTTISRGSMRRLSWPLHLNSFGGPDQSLSNPIGHFRTKCLAQPAFA